MKKHWLFMAMAAFVAFSCGDDDDNKGTKPGGDDDKTVEVASVTLSETNLTIYWDQELPTLTATVLPANATDKSVTWTSDKTDYITVSQTGGLTLVKQAEEDVTVVITATSKNGKKGTCSIALMAALEGGYKIIDASAELGFLFLDRNLGATEAYNGDSKNPNVGSVGNFYQFGKNTPVATGEETPNTSYDQAWNAEGADYKDWSVAENTPCPKGWRIPNKAEMKKIADAAYVDYDFDSQTNEEMAIAEALYNKLLFTRSNAWITDVVNSENVVKRRIYTTNELTWMNSGYLWTSEINTAGGTTTGGLKYAYCLSDNYSINVSNSGKSKENVVNTAMPIRCIKDAPAAPAE